MSPNSRTDASSPGSSVLHMSHEEAIHSASRRMVRVCDVCNRTSRQYTISLCAGCLAISYCGSQCQRNDWKKHKPVCRQQVAVIEETKRANRMPSVDLLFQWQTVHLSTLYYAAIHGLHLGEYPDNISTKAVFLQLSEPHASGSAPDIASAFRMAAVDVVDREALCALLIGLGAGGSSAPMDFVNGDDARSKTEGYLGSALVIIRLGEADILPLPLRVRRRHLPPTKILDWKEQVRLMIDFGKPYYHEDEYLIKLQRKEDRRQKNRQISRR